MNNFRDSEKFRFGEDGQVCWNRPGGTWADRVLDGVELDLSLYWGSGRVGFMHHDGGPTGEEIVGDRMTTGVIQETTKTRKKERGEGKFQREKKIPQKKRKKYPTKPKAKDSRYRRISKIARQLDMEGVGSHIEEKAVQEWSDFWDEKILQRERDEEEYWTDWEKKFEDSPGEYGLISLKIPVNMMGNSIYDVDNGGVNTSERMPWHCDADYDPLPEEWYGDLLLPKELLYFTYWDKEKKMYVWRSLDYHQGGEWLHDIFEYSPSVSRMKDIFQLEKLMPWSMNRGYWISIEDNPFSYQIDGVSTWRNGIDWEVVWCVMDKLRTGEYRDHIFEKPDGFMKRSYPATHWGYQVPNIRFIN